MRSATRGRAGSDRYRPGRELGRGRRAVVLTAEDGLLGRTVALKLPLPGHEAAALEEARRLARVASPHVVALLDFLPGPAPALVLELLVGTTLREALRAVGRLPLAAAAPLVHQILEGLGAMHSAGFVHGDLKPENVWRTPEGTVKLFDPGASGDATALYAAPEVGRGAMPTVSADLYAVGVVAFEVLAGRPPFDASDAAELAARKNTETAPSVRTSGVSLPDPVEAWIQRLLSASPAGRFADAETALRAWEECTARLATPTSAAVLLHPRAWERMRAVLDRGGAVVVTGERGLGKSTLLAGWCAAAVSSGSVPLLVSQPPGLPREALGAWRRAVQAAAPQLGATAAALFASPGRGAAAELAVQDRLVEAIARHPERLALAVDEPECCDGATRRLVLRLLGDARAERLAVCVAHDDTSGGRSAESVRDALVADATWVRLVSPEPEVWPAFVGCRLGSRVGDLVVEHVRVRSGGNPLFAVLLLDELRARGALRDAGEAWVFRPEQAGFGVPAAAVPLLDRRLRGLDASTRALLEVASLCGARFETACVAGAAGVTEAALGTALHAAAREHGLVQREAGAWVFRPPLVAEHLASGLATEERAALHARLAAALLTAVEPDAAAIGTHLHAAGDPAAALPYLERAASTALAAHEPQAALRLLDLACAAADRTAVDEPGAVRRIELGLVRGRALQELAAWDAAYAELETVAMLAQAWGCDTALLGARRAQGEIEYARSRFDAAIAAWLGAQECAARLGDEPELHELLLKIGNVHFERGALETAAAAYARVLEFAAARCDRDLEARAAHNVALVECLQGRKESAVRFFDRSLRCFLDLGRDDAVARLYHNIGMIYLELGNWAEARNFFGRCMQLAAATGQEAILAVSCLDDAEACLRLGAEPEAAAAVERALALSRERGDEVGVANALRLQASLAAAAGDVDGAEATLRDAQERLQQLGQPLHEGLCWKELGAVRLRAGRVPAAAAALAEAARVFAALDAAEHAAEVAALQARCQEEPACRP